MTQRVTNKEFMDNQTYFTGLKVDFNNGIDRDTIVKHIDNNYCDGLVFDDEYDKMEYIVKLCQTWNIFN